MPASHTPTAGAGLPGALGGLGTLGTFGFGGSVGSFGIAFVATGPSLSRFARGSDNSLPSTWAAAVAACSRALRYALGSFSAAAPATFST